MAVTNKPSLSELEATFISEAEIIRTSKGELENIDEISQKNEEVIHFIQNKIVNNFSDEETKRIAALEKTLTKSLQHQEKLTSYEASGITQKQILNELDREIKETELQVAKLLQKKKTIEEELRLIEEESNKCTQDVTTKLHAYKQAASYIYRFLKIKVKYEESPALNIKGFKVVFSLGDKKYPVRICLDKTDNRFLEFDAMGLIDQETTERMLEKVRETGDLAGLCFSLRKYLILKQ